MKLLLDTHAFLWFICGDAALSGKGRSLIEDGANDKFVSVVSLWEIAIKTSLGKLPLSRPFDQLIPQQLQLNGFEILGLKAGHVTKLSQLPFYHRDPFDRMLVAQCLAENLLLVSNDAALDVYTIGRYW